MDANDGTDFKSGLQDIRHNITEMGVHVHDLGGAVDVRSEDQEMLWCRVMTLKEQEIEIQMKQEVLENISRWNNICISGMPKRMEGSEIMAFTAELLQTINGDKDAPLLARDRPHCVAFAPGHTDPVPDILTQVHFLTDKELSCRLQRARLI
ncbi:hypothetical protein NDU88_004594 [Pleurodeles waltl]|uniref:Uncharacterized protein n=1 Tax=Pleurodeles waltl TaxID=8319 RepID=A0AAV7VHI4_PLEWA|nr:hypothetical protein NDU88_004594 [Pleurodeles waltl]